MWTDTLQVIIMYGAMLTVILKGVNDIGGNWVIWERAHEGNRLELWKYAHNCFYYLNLSVFKILSSKKLLSFTISALILIPEFGIQFGKTCLKSFALGNEIKITVY